jgi:putative DNA primase/helicase
VALEGDPGIGKSSLVAKIIAHVTTGKAFPNVLENAPPPRDFVPRNVCLFTSEDDAADTLVPRILINGGDVSRVFLIDGWEQPDGAQGIVTMQDLGLLKEALERYTPVLMVFDPVQSFFGRGVDMNHANDTRPVLDAVAALCKAHGCTPLYVRHLGKARRDKAIHAALGSIDIAGNMRSMLFLASDPNNKARRILAHSKANNAPQGQSLAYLVQSVAKDIPTPEGNTVTVEAPWLMWDGLSTLTADDLASPPLADEDEKPALEQAKEFLRELLAAGPVLYAEIQGAGKQAGISTKTLKRAKPLVGAKSRRRPEEGTSSKDWSWEWFLDAPRGSGADTPTDGPLDPEPQPKENQEIVLEGLEGQPTCVGGDGPLGAQKREWRTEV